MDKSVFIDTFSKPINNSKSLPMIYLGEFGSLGRGVKHRPEMPQNCWAVINFLFRQGKSLILVGILPAIPLPILILVLPRVKYDLLEFYVQLLQ